MSLKVNIFSTNSKQAAKCQKLAVIDAISCRRNLTSEKSFRISATLDLQENGCAPAEIEVTSAELELLNNGNLAGTASPQRGRGEAN